MSYKENALFFLIILMVILIFSSDAILVLEVQRDTNHIHARQFSKLKNLQ